MRSRPPYQLRVWVLPILALLSLPRMEASAQDVKFSASVDRTEVAVGEQFELNFTVDGTTSPDNFKAPALSDFQVLTGPNPSTNMQIFNGRVSSSITYAYVLAARSEGKHTIGPATVSIGAKSYSSEPIVMTVAKGAPQTAKKGTQAAEGDVSKQIGDNLLVRVLVDKSHVVLGEQITATYKLYTRVAVANYNVTKLPGLSGFWNEDLDVPRQAQPMTETINGKQYRTVALKKVALFPQRAGTLQLDPMELTCVVQMQSQRRNNDFFDQFFNDPFFGGVRNVDYAVKSEPVKITVDPLPTAAPAGFAGAVGKYTMESWLDRKQVKTNDPVTLRVKISGKGNLKLLGAPAINFPPDLEKYDPKIADNISNTGGVISGSRTFEYLLIPRHAGQQVIPSFPFSYYDLDRKGYVALKSPEFTVDVEKGADLPAGVASGISKEDVKLLGEDIRFIKSGVIKLRKRGETFAGSPLFIAMTAFPVLAFVGFAVFTRRRAKLLGDTVLLKNRKANKMALKRLKLAKEFLGKKQAEQFYTEISRALWGYVGDKLGIPPADLTVDGVRGSLAGRNVPEAQISDLASTIERCEFARFAPGAGAGEMDLVYRSTVTLISSIEDSIR